MRKIMLTLAGALLLSGTALAQTPPPPPATPPAAAQAHDGHKMVHMHRGMMSRLSPEGRKVLEAEMASHKDRREARHAARKAARDKVRAAMLAEPYNATALRRAFDEERALASTHMKEHHEHMVTLLGKLSAADRKLFAESMGNMEKRMKWRHKRGHGDHEGMEGHDHKDGPPPPAQ